MPVRIYALAKDLKMDSKDLVDICVKVGISGKGSALASLDDDEVVKLKNYLSGAKKPAAGAPPSSSGPLSGAAGSKAVVPPVPPLQAIGSTTGGPVAKAGDRDTVSPYTREDYIPTTAPGKIRVISSPRKPTPLEAKTADARKDREKGAEIDRPTPSSVSSGVGAPPIEPALPGNYETDTAEHGAISLKSTSTLDQVSTLSSSPGSISGSPSPGSTAPGSTAPGSTAPGSTAPGSTAPGSASSGTTSPGGVSPSISTPAAPLSQGTNPTLGAKASAASTASGTSQFQAPLAPMRSFDRPRGGPIRDIGRERAKSNEGSGDETPKPRKKREPVINLAKIPTVKQPVLTPKSNEPAPQKPDIRLPKDAIAGSRAGNRAPLEHLTKTLGKPETSSKKPTPGKAAAELPPESPLAKPAGKRGRDGKGPEEEGAGLLGIASARADRQKARKTRMLQKGTTGPEEEEGPQSRRGKTLTRKGTNTAAPRKERVVLELPCNVRSFSEVAGVPVSHVLKAMMGMGMMANINSQIDTEIAEVLATELGVEVTFAKPPTLEESMITDLTSQVDEPDSLSPRPPVITFLGHVDHGKTSLLDKIIGIDVAAGEAGGITQHIRAYQVERSGKRISFVDTPGHEAFTEMRARGANVTDIAVLVVAADDGVMPQTEEAISHAKAAGVPIVVALNKSDLRGTDINRIMQQLATQNLLPSEWGGDTEVVKTSAVTGDGLDELVETLFGIAELHEFKANADRPGIGTCLEAEQRGERGVVAKLIVQTGTLRVGDIVVCGAAHGRVKAMYDTLRPHTRITEAGPSTPVNITGLDIAPAAGEKFYVLENIAQAREIAEQRQSRVREQGLSVVTPKVSFEKFQQLLSEGRLGKQDEVAVLNLIIRADVRGSIEAIQKELSKFQHPEVQVRVLQYSVGGITTADVALANASDAVVVGFNVIPDEAARQLAEKHNVEIRRYDIIYKLTEDIKAMLEGKLRPEERVVEMGRAVVKQTFSISRVGVVAGCYVAQGNITRGCRIRVNRDGRTIGDYALDSLRREKEDVREVQRGMECGIRLAGFNDVKKDDVLEAYRIEEIARTL